MPHVYSGLCLHRACCQFVGLGAKIGRSQAICLLMQTILFHLQIKFASDESKSTLIANKGTSRIFVYS